MDRELRADVRASADRVRVDSVPRALVVLVDLVPVDRAELHRRRRPAVRSVPLHGVVAVVVSSIPRPKKVR